MSTATQNVLIAGQAELCPETVVRNLDVINYLANSCKWCCEYIFDSSTKPRKFCDNNNVCCNNYSRRGVSKTVWEALKRASRYLVVNDTPSFAPTTVKKRVKTKFTDGQGDFKAIDVYRVEPMRLFPSAKGRPTAKPLSKDLPCPLKPVRFNKVTPKDVDWANRQSLHGEIAQPSTPSGRIETQAG